MSNWLKNCVHFNFDPFMYGTDSNDNFDNIVNIKLREQLFILYSHVPDIPSKHSAKNLKEKAVKSRALYNLRKMMLDCENRRIDAINTLSEKIEKHNRIQEERNEILKRLISSQDDKG